MPNKTVYKSLRDINEQQEKIMAFIILWVKEKKTPVPQKEIVLEMKTKGVGLDSVKWSLDVLLAKGYIRRGYTERKNTTVYVQLRGL